jgi:hypothetical protein
VEGTAPLAVVRRASPVLTETRALWCGGDANSLHCCTRLGRWLSKQLGRELIKELIKDEALAVITLVPVRCSLGASIGKKSREARRTRQLTARYVRELHQVGSPGKGEERNSELEPAAVQQHDPVHLGEKKT